MLINIKLQFNSHLFMLRFTILVIQNLNILLPSVPYLFWFCQQFSCLILYCLTCTVCRFLSLQLSNLCINLVELFDLILITRCTHFPTIFLLLDLFLFSVRHLGGDIFFSHPLYSCSSTSFSLASSPLWLSLSMVFWQLFLSGIPHFLQHFSLLPLLNSPISPLLFPG